MKGDNISLKDNETKANYNCDQIEINLNLNIAKIKKNKLYKTTKEKAINYNNELSTEQRRIEETKQQIKLNYIVIVLVALAQGIQGLSDLALSYFYKDDLKLHPFEVTQIVSLLTLPWIVKPVYGFISDSFPIFGYRRKPYLFMSGISVSICFLFMGLYVNTYLQTLTVLMIVAVSTAFYNVIGEALVVELSQKQKEFDPDAGAKNVSLYFLIRSCGNLTASLFIGPLLEIMDKRSIFLLTSFCPILLILSSILLVEKTSIEIEEDIKLQSNIIDKELNTKNNASSYGTISTANSPANVYNKNNSTKNDIKEQFDLFWSFVKKPVIYRPVIFILIFMATPSYSDPMFYFYTTQLNFSTLIMGRLKLVYGIASVSGIFIYNKFLRSYSFKGIILSTTIICIFLNMGSILLVERINILLGIPDLVFCFATDALTIALGEINTMPLLVLACNICPKNIEGTLYAFLMSVSNLGTMLAGQFGSSLSSALGITNNNFANLSLMILIANIFLIAPMPVMFCLDDSAYQNSVKYEQEKESNTKNNDNKLQYVDLCEKQLSCKDGMNSDVCNNSNTIQNNLDNISTLSFGEYANKKPEIL